MGGLSAFSRGFDAIAYLDADCWYAPEHVASALALVQKGAYVALSSRQIVLTTGEHVREDADAAARLTADTNCFLITARAAPLACIWAMMPKSLAIVGDKVVFRAMRHHRYNHGWTGQTTVFYESRWRVHFEAAGKEPPPDAQYVAPGWIQREYDREAAVERLGFDPFPGL